MQGPALDLGQYIFVAVPDHSESAPEIRSELELELQRRTVGAVTSVASISEKFSLLSGARTRDSSRVLETKRCFSIRLTPHEISRKIIARGLLVRNERERLLVRPSSLREGASSTQYSSTLVPRPQWIRDSQPDLSDDEADAVWEAGSGRLFGEARHLSSTPDVSSFTGGNTLKVTVEIHHSAKGGPVKVKVALYTQSDVTTCLRQYLMDVHLIQPDEVSGVGGSASFTEEGTLYIFSEPKGQCVAIPALVSPLHQLPVECAALLGVPALLQPEVALDQHLRLPRFSPLICHLGEKKLREWLVHHPNSSIDTAPFDLNTIQINPELTFDQIQVVKKVIQKYANVFEGHENSLPKPFATEPITLKFKPDAQPQSIPHPRWNVAQKEIVTRWAEEGLKNGSLDPSTSAWASRVHLVLKPPGNTTTELADLKDCKLRPCGDYRLVNSQIIKIAPNLPTGLHQLEQASGYRLYFEADSVACYHSFRLAPAASREALAVWTPIGLCSPQYCHLGRRSARTLPLSC